jgi:hypothetical protein
MKLREAGSGWQGLHCMRQRRACTSNTWAAAQDGGGELNPKSDKLRACRLSLMRLNLLQTVTDDGALSKSVLGGQRGRKQEMCS